MKLTSVERIGRSQLIPGVRRTVPEATDYQTGLPDEGGSVKLGSIGEAVLRVLAFLFLPLLMVVALVSGLLAKPLQRRTAEVAALLRRRLLGTQERGEWDEFVCCRIADPSLELLRTECVRIEEEEGSQLPPVYLTAEGERRMRALLGKLEGVEQGDAPDEAGLRTEPRR